MDATPHLSPNVLNGEPALAGEFPHMAALGYPSKLPNRTWDFLCGGSVISEYYILTAAHCISTDSLPEIARLGEVSVPIDRISTSD